MSSLYKKSIDIAQSSIDAKQLDRITDFILKSKIPILFGIGDSLITAESFTNKLIKICILAFSATQNSDAECIIDIMKPSDLGIFGTYQQWFHDPDGNRFELMQYTEESYQVTGHID